MDVLVNKLDELVYEVYWITEEEKKIIEESLKQDWIMENKTKVDMIIIGIILIIIVWYLYSQGWFTAITPYIEKFIKVISRL